MSQPKYLVYYVMVFVSVNIGCLFKPACYIFYTISSYYIYESFILFRVLSFKHKPTMNPGWYVRWWPMSRVSLIMWPVYDEPNKLQLFWILEESRGREKVGGKGAEVTKMCKSVSTGTFTPGFCGGPPCPPPQVSVRPLMNTPYCVCLFLWCVRRRATTY